MSTARATLLSSIASAVLLFVCGCSVDLNPVPNNADSSEAAAVVALKPLAENIAWNDSGYVRTVDLGGDRVTDRELACVASFRQLQFLNLYGSRISDRGLQNLEQLQSLISLGLAWTQITDDGLARLEHLKQLNTIDLSHTNITDAGLKTLEQHSKLERVFLEGTKVTNEGVKHFRQALPGCQVQR